MEPGTSGSAPIVQAALRELGVGPDDLATVVVTHIHLDHAGGVGDIAKMYPKAEVVVHEKGARHLADPARLMRSARMVYGDTLDTLFGELKPTDAPGSGPSRTPASSTSAAGGGWSRTTPRPRQAPRRPDGLPDRRPVRGRRRSIYIPETADVKPATPPPDFDLDTALSSLGKFRSLGPQRLLFAHYGPVTEVDDTLERSAEELRVWVDAVQDAKDQDLDLDHAVAMVVDRTRHRYAITSDGTDPDLIAKYEVLNSAESNVTGILHALNKHA